MIKIALFEDHPIVLRSLTSFFEEQAQLEVVFTAKLKAELYEKVREHSDIDIFIIDLLGIDVRGLEIYEYLQAHFPSSNIISFTSIASAVLVENLLNIGVKGYVNKNQDIEDLLVAVETVYRGDIYLPEDYSFLVKKVSTQEKNTLTVREIEIVNLIALELTTNEIARRLEISVNTVENHRKSIFKKLGVKNVAGMIREVGKLGYLS